MRATATKHVVTLLAAGFILGGCQSVPVSDPNVQAGPNDVDKIVYLQDFPIPRGAKWDNDRTLILGSGKAWTGRLAFTAPMTDADAFQFFQEQMIKLGWQPISLVRGKNSVLTFVRQDRAALVEFNSHFMSGISASITVTPR